MLIDIALVMESFCAGTEIPHNHKHAATEGRQSNSTPKMQLNQNTGNRTLENKTTISRRPHLFVGSRSRAGCLKRNAAMDDSIGGS